MLITQKSLIKLTLSKLKLLRFILFSQSKAVTLDETDNTKLLSLSDHATITDTSSAGKVTSVSYTKIKDDSSTLKTHIDSNLTLADGKIIHLNDNPSVSQITSILTAAKRQLNCQRLKKF